MERTASTAVAVSGLVTSDSLPTITYGYDDATGLMLTTTQGSEVLTSTYDALGRELTYADADGVTTTLPTTWTTTGSWSMTARHSQSPLSAQTNAYDRANRLVRVEDTAAGISATRVYGFDKQSDRTALTTYTAAADGTGQTATSGSSYDSADRLAAAGYTYDQLGRMLTVSAAGLTTGNSPLGITYFDTDLPSGTTQGNTSNSYNVDPEGQYRIVCG